MLITSLDGLLDFEAHALLTSACLRSILASTKHDAAQHSNHNSAEHVALLSPRYLLITVSSGTQPSNRVWYVDLKQIPFDLGEAMDFSGAPAVLPRLLTRSLPCSDTCQPTALVEGLRCMMLMSLYAVQDCGHSPSGLPCKASASS